MANTDPSLPELGDFKPRHRQGVVLQARLIPGLMQIGAWPASLRALEQQIAAAAGTAVPGEPGGSSESDAGLVMRIAAGTFLIECANPELGETLAAAIKPDLGTVTNLAHARVAINVSGSQADAVLAKGLAIDLHPDAFPVQQVAQSAIDEIGLLIRHVAEQSFDLYVYRSFATALWDWLLEASH